jgi:hypothetical protein
MIDHDRGLAHAAFAAWLCALATIPGGCITHTVQSAPIEIKPIHITMDINLRVQRELDEFFDFEKPSPSTPAPTSENPGKEH